MDGISESLDEFGGHSHGDYGYHHHAFSSSTTHHIEVDSEKQVIAFDHNFTKFILYEAPLIKGSEIIIRENTNSLFFLNQRNWT